MRRRKYAGRTGQEVLFSETYILSLSLFVVIQTSSRRPRVV